MSHPDEAQGSCAEEAARLMLALKASNEGIWDWWTGKPEIYYSRRILEFFQCSASTAPNIFLEPHEMVCPEDRERFSRALANALDPGGPELFSIDCRLKTGGDEWVWLRIRGTVVRARGGEAQRIAGSMIDISRRKAAEAQIEEERHILRNLIDRVPLQVYFKDLESRFVLVNRQMAEWNGQPSPESVVGKHDRDFFASAHWMEADADEKKIMATGHAITGKLEHEIREDGKETWVLSSKFPWIDRGGQMQGTFGVSSDVTELVEAKQQADSYASELAIRNQAYEEELQLAREIQQTLAGSSFPDIGRNGTTLRFGARYLPITGMAGDFFEILRISDDTAGVLICDVMGHGVRSALVVAMLRGLLEKQRRSAADPSAFLHGLNIGLNSILDRAGATMFATAFYAVLDLGAGTLRYACAGHPGAIATGPGGVKQLASTRKEKGPGLGLMPKAEYPAGEVQLSDVDRILLFTDGILEAENEAGEPFLEKRLMATASECAKETLEGMLDIVLNRVLHYSEGHHFDDDVCLLGVELMPMPAAIKC
ncbi:SpoIIE family protein phosphatase [Luteolibacter marinus]|uniref:SpoIIE family protein phosphatase n=1 Tax=Luteolibacter marinus TaxID=2776705 RepID=UPI001866652D|nr:SpoIIE family protein phosphatase [Luteolibacter marinus]